jgi:hypothetical protein
MENGSWALGLWAEKWHEESFEEVKDRFNQYNNWLIYTGQLCYSRILSFELRVIQRACKQRFRWRIARRFFLRNVPEELHMGEDCDFEHLAQKYPEMTYEIQQP